MASGRFRKLEREGQLRLDEEPLEIDVPQRAAREPSGNGAPPVPVAAPDPAPRGADPLLPSSDRDEPGFGTVLAAGVLVACIMALVSIPVRRIFDATGAESSDFELLSLVAVTLAVYASVRRRLRRL